MPCHGEAAIRVGQEEEGEGGIVGKSLYRDSQGEEGVKQGKLIQDQLILIILAGSGAQELSLGVWHLVTLGCLGQVDSGLECESLIKEVNGDVNSGLVGLYLEKCLWEQGEAE